MSNNNDKARPPPIKTNLAPNVRGRTYAAVASASSSADSAEKTGSSKPMTAATSPYPPSAWTPLTPVEATLSANVPSKPTWDLTQPPSAAAKVDVSPVDAPPRVQMPPSIGLSPSVGLGLTFGNLSFSDLEANPASTPSKQNTGIAINTIKATPTTTYQIQQDELNDAQTSPFKHQPDVNSSAHTFPLTQRTFDPQRAVANQPRNRIVSAWVTESNKSKNDKTGLSVEFGRNDGTHYVKTDSGAQKATDDIRSIVSNPFEEEVSQVTSPTVTFSEGSILSELTPHYTESNPELQGRDPPQFAQQSHSGSYPGPKDGSLSHKFAFPTAQAILQTVNPSHWKMPWGVSHCMYSDTYKSLR